MTDVEIGAMDATIEFEPEVITASPATMGTTGAGASDADQIRRLLRPIILELLEEELNQYVRARG